MAAETIQSADMSIEDLFKSFYQVPVYQREYVWREDNVQRLLEDTHDLFVSTTGMSEYFIGSIVTQQCTESAFDLIDGQQRVTTFFLILCAIRHRFIQLGVECPPELEPQIRASYTDSHTAQTKFNYRVTLQYSDGQNVLEAIGGADDHCGVDALTRRTVSSENIINAYELAAAFMLDTFRDDAIALKRFWLYLTRRVKLIRVMTGSLSDALRVFETINDRGIGLDAMDLLKNLLFIHASPDQYEALRDRWETLAKRLYSKEKPLRFLRYYLLSDYAALDLQANQVYEWVTKRENANRLGYPTDPLAFVDQLLGASDAYVAFVEGKNAIGLVSQPLANLKFLAGSARQQLIILLAGRHLPSDAFDALAKQLEDLFFIFIVTRTPKNVFESRFAKWAPMVRLIEDLPGVVAFAEAEIEPLKAQYSGQFDLSLKQLGELSLPKYRRKYLLAKLAQHLNDGAYPGAWKDLSVLLDKSYEIEHILPVNPRSEIEASFDKPDALESFKHRLGNLTLVEKPINASIANAPFEMKRPEYAKSNLLLTSSIANIEPVGNQTTVNRVLGQLRTFETWQSKDIDDREELMLRLAHDVWGLPVELPIAHTEIVSLESVVESAEPTQGIA